MRLHPVAAWLATGLLVFGAGGALTACGGGQSDRIEPTFSEHVLSGADLTGWVLVAEPALYDRSTLYQRVNGEDGLYLGAGFTKLTTLELKQDRRRATTAMVDVFELGSPLSAFGIYSRHHDEEAVVPQTGTSACITGPFAVLYKDRFVVKINADSTAARGGESVQGLADLAARIAGGLPGSEAPPCELGFLPEEGLEKGSTSYVETALNGHDFLPGGLQADYRIEGQGMRVFLSFFPDDDAAVAALGRYGEILGGTTPVTPGAEGGGEPRFTGAAPDGENVTVTTRGRFLVGARGYEDLRAAEQLTRDTLEAIEGGCPAAGD